MRIVAALLDVNALTPASTPSIQTLQAWYSLRKQNSHFTCIGPTLCTSTE